MFFGSSREKHLLHLHGCPPDVSMWFDKSLITCSRCLEPTLDCGKFRGTSNGIPGLDAILYPPHPTSKVLRRIILVIDSPPTYTDISRNGSPMSASLPSIPLEILLQILRNLDIIDVVRLGMVSHYEPYPQTWGIDNRFCASHAMISANPPKIATSGLIKCRVTFGRDPCSSSPFRI